MTRLLKISVPLLLIVQPVFKVMVPVEVKVPFVRLNTEKLSIPEEVNIPPTLFKVNTL